MKQSGNKVLVIALIVIAILAIAGGVFAYVFFATDMLKSEQVLFAKYLTQNIEELTQTINLNKVDELEEKLKQNKYEETTTISYTEKGQNLPSGTTTIDIQKDPIGKKEYGIISLETQEQEDTLEIEYMHEEDMYSLRFTNAVMQFLSVENNNLKELARNLGMEEKIVETLPDKIDFESLALDKLKLTKEEKNKEIERYVNTIYNNIPKEKYTQSKNTVITVNGKTITTNAYVLTISEQDIKTLTIKLLETLKQDEIILSKIQTVNEMLKEYDSELYTETFGDIIFKDAFAETLQVAIDELTAEEITGEKNIVITIYEQNRKTVRIKAEEGLKYITLDTIELEGKKQIDLNYTSIDENNTQLSEGITIVKENDNNITVKFKTVNGEEQQDYEIDIELTENGENVKLNITLNDENGQTVFSRNINFTNEINYKVELDDSNNIVLNQLSNEQMSTIFTIAGEKITTEYIENIKMEHLAPVMGIATIAAAPVGGVVAPIITTIGLQVVKKGQEAVENADLSQTQIEMFNSEFRWYEGNDMATIDVKSLLDKVITHNQMEANNLTERYVIVTGDIELKSNDTIAPEVHGNDIYSIKCKKNEKGLIDEIIVKKAKSSLLDAIDEEDQITENEENSSTTSENAEYEPAEFAAIAPEDVASLDQDSEQTIANTASKTIGLIRTIGTIVIVMIIFL